MNPKPFSALKNFTVPVVNCFSSLEVGPPLWRPTTRVARPPADRSPAEQLRPRDPAGCVFLSHSAGGSPWGTWPLRLPRQSGCRLKELGQASGAGVGRRSRDQIDSFAGSERSSAVLSCDLDEVA